MCKQYILCRIQSYKADSLLRLERVDESIQMAAFALDYDERSYRAYFIRALAHIKSKNSEAAQNDLLDAINTCDKEEAEALKKIKATYAKVMQNQEGTINPKEEEY